MAEHPVPSERARELVRGGFDTHVHVAPDFAPRRITDLELARRCLELGLAGFGLKSHYTSTAERAAVVTAAVPGVRVLGTITLNHAVGGLNATAVEIAAREGARIVWLPDRQLGERVGEVEHADPDGKVPVWVRFELDLREAGVRPRAGAGRRRRRRRRCPSRSTCWPWSPATTWCSPPATCRATRSSRSSTPRSPPACGTIVVTHPEFPSQRIGHYDQDALAERGALMERTFTTPYTGKCSWEEVFAATRAVGAERTVWSTDLGQTFNPPVEDGLALMADRFLEAGFTEEEVRTMAVDEHPAAWPERGMSRRVQVIGAHSADFVWRAGGAVAKAVGRRRHGRGHRALLRRARRVGRAVEGGGPDDRERQAHPPRRGRGRRRARSAPRSAASTSATTRCRSTATRCC